jgi:N-acetylglutamate synthase-like GNAT family acetyltransferase
VQKCVIRQAAASEQRSLVELERRAGLANPGDREAILAHPEVIEVPLDQIVSGDVFVLETNGVIAGFAAVKSRSDGDTDLDGLFVEPEMQRRGSGGLLVEHCAVVARARGSQFLFVIGNLHAEAFYLACGFEPIGTCETRFAPALLMRKKL